VACGARVAMLIAVAGACGCAERAARNATAGAVSSAQQMQATMPEAQQFSRVAGGRAVEGAVAALDQPEQQAQIRKLVDAAVTEAVASAVRAAFAPVPAAGVAGAPARGAAPQLAGQIGRAATEDALGRVAVQLGGDGALRQGLVATSAVATDAAVSAALGGLFPECRGDDAAAGECRIARVQALTRATAASVSAGVRDSLAWPMVFLAAVVGMTLGVLAHWIVTLRRRRPGALRHA
jgi:hypothetical protein